MINSKRLYNLTGFEPDIISVRGISLDDIIDKNDKTEMMYALQEQIDNILDMELNEALHIDLSRDNVNFKGVIKRIK